VTGGAKKDKIYPNIITPIKIDMMDVPISVPFKIRNTFQRQEIEARDTTFLTETLTFLQNYPTRFSKGSLKFIFQISNSCLLRMLFPPNFCPFSVSLPCISQILRTPFSQLFSICFCHVRQLYKKLSQIIRRFLR